MRTVKVIFREIEAAPAPRYRTSVLTSVGPLIPGPKPYRFIGFGGIPGPKPYRFIGFGGIPGPLEEQSRGGRGRQQNICQLCAMFTHLQPKVVR